MWATKAAFGVVGPDAAGCLVTTDFPIFRADNTRLLPAYMRLLFSTRNFQQQASLLAVGTTERRRLKEPDFLKIRVTLPSVHEQRRMIALIAAVDTAVTSLRAEIRAVVDVAQRIADAAFSFAASTGHLSSVGAVTSKVQNGVMYKRGAAEGGWPVTRIETMSTGRINLLRTGRAGFTDANAKNFVLAEGDILFSNKNSLDRVGATAFVRAGDLPLINGDNILQLRADGVKPTYLFVLLRSRQMRDAIRRVTRPAVNQASVNAGQVRALPVPVIDEQHQERIGEQYMAALNLVERVESEMTALRSFRSTLLSSLLSQSISVTDSYDSRQEQGMETVS
ncbi:hypothetical protein CO540_21685 [Micromonospora sp. WMMA2032]|nr:hypothetical protein CO540_21685 [Micromonospora sp. WMMA2032]